MLVAICQVLAYLSGRALCAAPAPLGEAMHNAKPGLTGWLNPSRPFTVKEAQYAEKMIVQFFDSKGVRGLEAVFSRFSNYDRDDSFTDIAGLRSCFVAVLAEHAGLHPALLEYCYRCPVASLCLHKLFKVERSALPPDYARPDKVEGMFMDRLEMIPAAIKYLDYGLYFSNAESCALTLVTLLSAKTDWEKAGLDVELGILFAKLLVRCVDPAFFHGTVEALVDELYHMKILNDFQHCRAVFPVLLKLADRFGTLADVKLFGTVGLNTDAAVYLASELSEYWVTNGVKWEDESTLADFCYAHRKLLLVSSTGIAAALQRKLNPGCNPPFTTVRAMLSDPVEAGLGKMPVKLTYVLYYFYRQTNQKSRHINKQPKLYDALDDEKLAALLCYTYNDYVGDKAKLFPRMLDHMHGTRDKRTERAAQVLAWSKSKLEQDAGASNIWNGEMLSSLTVLSKVPIPIQ
ncbi:hypothetical protein PAPHI01_0922 [Pancytospora philotis]|nr:hypothetical protein PAPHI01_0922 [Pancytospora philotis]